MKPTTFLVSALATMVAAAPAAEKKVEERAFNFDANVFGGFNKFNQVNLDYLLNINNLNLGLLQQLAVQNNFNINPFANLFQLQAGQFAIQDVLLLQQLSDLLFFANAGVLNQFDLAQFQFGGILNTGLLNLGGISLNPFIDQLGSNVITQVQTVASQVLPGINGINGGILGGGISGGLNSGLTSVLVLKE